RARAVQNNGSVQCWGKDDQGEASPPAGAFSQLSAGHLHTCGVKSNGQVWCWGENADGQIGPGVVGGAYPRVAAGGAHSCAIRDTGILNCWGADDENQASPPPGAFNRRSISARDNYTCE